VKRLTREQLERAPWYLRARLGKATAADLDRLMDEVEALRREALTRNQVRRMNHKTLGRAATRSAIEQARVILAGLPKDHPVDVARRRIALGRMDDPPEESVA
jgi:hypothetical protein